ncbi:MAG TPA: hypothetical protein VFZ28_05630, partial [Burkholderiaceae bacterium]|nr:hypothetical protein [Burkholderiaceae bacterium]
WLARLLGLDPVRDADDGIVSFEHVDGSRLAADEVHQSDSMRLDEAGARDFAETLPAFSHRHAPQPPYPPRAAAWSHSAH